MRILHAGPDHVRGGLYRRGPRRQQRGNRGVDERKHLPLRRIPRHTRGDSGRSSQGSTMRSFEYIRVDSVDDALRAKAANPDARFLAGGTNLIDLVKYDVEEPDSL